MALLNEARQKTAGMDYFINPTGNEPVLRILKEVARHVLDQAIKGMPVVYGEQVSALGFHKENGLLAPLRFDTAASFVPVPGLGLHNEFKPDIQVAFRMFGGLIEGGAISPERIGKCHCGRYFLSARLGQKKSRACSKDHQAVLISRELRSSKQYREMETKKNARRMAAVREGEKLMIRRIEEGKPHKERTCLLRDWNEKNGAILWRRGLSNILEGEV